MPRMEVVIREGSDETLSVGRAGSQALIFKTHRRGEDGLNSPTSIAADSNVRAEFVGEATEKALEGGIVERSREIRVDLPPSDKSGNRRSELIVVWGDGFRHRVPVAWTVSPLVRGNAQRHRHRVKRRPGAGPSLCEAKTARSECSPCAARPLPDMTACQTSQDLSADCQIEESRANRLFVLGNAHHDRSFVSQVTVRERPSHATGPAGRKD